MAKDLTQRKNTDMAVTENTNALTLGQKAEYAAVAVAAEAKAVVEARFVMAMKQPRNEDLARTKILNACKNLTFAESALYKKPVGGANIEGLGIRFAEEAARHWKNIFCQAAAIYEDDDRRNIRITVLDLESNLGWDKTAVIEKTVERKFNKDREIVGERLNSKGERVFIVKTTEDELLNKENSMISKTLRNGILRCLPQHILEEALDEIKQTIKAGVSKDPEEAKRAVLDNFAKLNILPDQIEKYLKHPLSLLSPVEITDLKGIFNAIKDGQAKWQDFLEIENAEFKEEKQVTKTAFKAGNEADHTSVEQPLKAAKDWEELDKNLEEEK